MTHARSVEYSVGPATCNRATGSALTAMTSTAEKAFLRVAVAAIPRVTEIVQGFPPNDQAGSARDGRTVLPGGGVGLWLH